HNWLRYLGEVTDLVVRAAHGATTAAPGPAAVAVAAEVVLDHHRMLIGLPGTAYARTATQRQELERALARLHHVRHPNRSEHTSHIEPGSTT
ncbi:hypothetical protein, partial [Streptomyces broussonetiae]|uniref:hypothetical protein n=1 Tax=Streptomyces broussonetiae TaxID=2686304 RepID=UPI0035DD37B5